MKAKGYKNYRFLYFIFSILLFESCNTLYNTRDIKIEVIEPAKVILPDSYNTVAVKYNNFNIGYNPKNSTYQDFDSIRIDNKNTDSIASKIYYQLFVENIKKQNFFDSIIECQPTDFSGISVIDSIVIQNNQEQGSSLLSSQMSSEEKVRFFVQLLNFYIDLNKGLKKSKIIDPQLGLYSKEELKSIAQSTNADVLISFDFYSSHDGIQFDPINSSGIEYVYTLAYWHFYDLKKLELQAFQPKIDTITWRSLAFSPKMLNKLLPPRNDAIFNAADIAGTEFAKFMIPHWVEKERIYYHSGHVELKKTKKLVEENKWMEAAKIWKANVNNTNKKIAAKSRFNMGLVCEIQGNYEAAIDWLVKSFHVLGAKNQEHSANCQQYIRIIAQRKLELNIINKQFFVDDVYPEK